MKVTTNGRVTIPHKIRKQLGMLPGSEVDFIAEGNYLKIVRADADASMGMRPADKMRGNGMVNMTNNEILALTRDDKVLT